jgi:hypothetical protein
MNTDTGSFDSKAIMSAIIGGLVAGSIVLVLGLVWTYCHPVSHLGYTNDRQLRYASVILRNGNTWATSTEPSLPN